jgi:hypothetical protein
MSEEQIETILERTRAAQAVMQSPRALAEMNVRGSEQPGIVDFTHDGESLLCGTDQGVRVYEWESVLAAAREMPKPIWSVDSPIIEIEFQAHRTSHTANIYALAHDIRGNRLLFGGLAGTVGFLDLESGRSGTFIDIPGRPAVLSLALSRDGSALACSVRPNFFGHDKSGVLQIWNYTALCERLGGSGLRVYKP